MRLRSTLFTVVITLIAAASAGAATLPHRTLVGPAEGVTAAASGKSVTVRFTGASAAWGKEHARQRVFVTCAARPEPGLFFRDEDTPSSGGGSTGFEDEGAKTDPEEVLAQLGAARVSPSGASVKARLSDPKADLCQVRGGYGASADTAWAVLTPRGTVALDEEQTGLRLADVVYAAAPKHVYRAAADVVALGGGAVVALDDPNGTPPAGKIGYWSKGRAMSVIATSAAGRRMAIQDVGNGMLRTNAFEQLLSWAPAEPPKGASSGSADDPLTTESGSGTSSSSGDEDDEVTAAEGLLSRVEGGEVVFRFTGKAAKAYRRVAGRRVVVYCMKAPERPLLGEALSFDGLTATKVRVPAHGGVIRGRAPAGRADVCGVETEDGGDVALGLLTPAGRRYMADFVVPLLFLFDARTPWVLAATAATRYPGAATYVAAHPDVSALATPGAALRAGEFGVWTDASQQALIAFGAPDGRRYLFADEGAGQVRTNAFTPLLAMFASLSQDGGIENLVSTS